MVGCLTFHRGRNHPGTVFHWRSPRHWCGASKPMPQAGKPCSMGPATDASVASTSGQGWWIRPLGNDFLGNPWKSISVVWGDNLIQFAGVIQLLSFQWRCLGDGWNSKTCGYQSLRDIFGIFCNIHRNDPCFSCIQCMIMHCTHTFGGRWCRAENLPVFGWWICWFVGSFLAAY